MPEARDQRLPETSPLQGTHNTLSKYEQKNLFIVLTFIVAFLIVSANVLSTLFIKSQLVDNVTKEYTHEQIKNAATISQTLQLEIKLSKKS